MEAITDLKNVDFALRLCVDPAATVATTATP
jgi:hypothetical protein